MLNKSPILLDFENIIKRLKEVLNSDKTEISRDSAIKRFELCFDLAWKTIKEYTKTKGVECYSPVDCFKSAFQLKLIEHNEKWLEMVKDRNFSAHVYKKERAEELYSRLPDYLKMFKKLSSKFNEK